MQREAAALLVPDVGVFKLLPRNAFSFDLETSWFSTLVALLDIVSYFLYVVLSKHVSDECVI